MKIKPVDHGLVLAAPTKGYIRGKGVHMSDLYGAYYAAYDKPRYRDDGRGPDKTKMELGTSFEEVLEPVLAHRLLGERPPEQTTKEGILFSPDYLFTDEKTGETVLGEFKCTWYSCAEAPTHRKFKRWLTQIQLYCHHLGITRARLIVFFVNGDYKPPSPKLLAWDLTFTESELAEENDIIMRFAAAEGMIPDGKRANAKNATVVPRRRARRRS